MKTLCYGLLAAAVTIGLSITPADAKGKKAGKKAKGKAEVAQVHPMQFTCGLNALLRSKQPKACGG